MTTGQDPAPGAAGKPPASPPSADSALAQSPAGGGKQRYFALYLLGDDQPFAVASKTDRGAPQRWVPGHGWIDTPLIADYFTGEDSGAKEITPEEAHTYMQSGLGALGGGAVEAIRGAK